MLLNRGLVFLYIFQTYYYEIKFMHLELRAVLNASMGKQRTVTFSTGIFTPVAAEERS